MQKKTSKKNSVCILRNIEGDQGNKNSRNIQKMKKLEIQTNGNVLKNTIELEDIAKTFTESIKKQIFLNYEEGLEHSPHNTAGRASALHTVQFQALDKVPWACQ